MPAKKHGLRVKHSATVGKVASKRGLLCTIKRVPEAWFLWVKICGKWKALTDLRFVREQDALRAAQALTAAGLDTAGAMNKAGLETVKQVACTYLQW